MNVKEIGGLIVLVTVCIALLGIVFTPVVQGEPIPANVVTAIIAIFTALLGGGASVGLVNWGEQRALRATRVVSYTATNK